MFAMLLTVCVTGTADCHPVMVSDGYRTQAGCITRSMQIAPQWTASNPGYSISGIHCTDEPQKYFDAGRV